MPPTRRAATPHSGSRVSGGCWARQRRSWTLAPGPPCVPLMDGFDGRARLLAALHGHPRQVQAASYTRPPRRLAGGPRRARRRHGGALARAGGARRRVQTARSAMGRPLGWGRQRTTTSVHVASGYVFLGTGPGPPACSRRWAASDCAHVDKPLMPAGPCGFAATRARRRANRPPGRRHRLVCSCAKQSKPRRPRRPQQATRQQATRQQAPAQRYRDPGPGSRPPPGQRCRALPTVPAGARVCIATTPPRAGVRPVSGRARCCIACLLGACACAWRCRGAPRGMTSACLQTGTQPRKVCATASASLRLLLLVQTRSTPRDEPTRASGAAAREARPAQRFGPA